jgi:hypothetical protein
MILPIECGARFIGFVGGEKPKLCVGLNGMKRSKLVDNGNHFHFELTDGQIDLLLQQIEAHKRHRVLCEPIVD